jgi:outer membrane protein assembly factor BamB
MCSSGGLIALSTAVVVGMNMSAEPPAERAATQPTTGLTSQSAVSADSGPDWPVFRGNSQLTGVAGSTLPDRLEVRWKYELGEGTSSTAAIAVGVVYVGADNGKLVALDLRTGKPKWEFRAADAIQSAPTIVAGLVIFGDEAGVVQACDTQTGVLRWSFKTNGRVISSANSKEDRLVFGSYDGGLYCLRIGDGGLIWKYDVGERVHGTPAIADEFVLVAACDGNLHVVGLSDGALVRKVALGSVSGAAAAVRGSRVFLGTYGEQVLAIDWQAGQVLWRFEDPKRQFPFLSSAAVTDELVIVGGQDKRLRGLEADTGKERWQLAVKGKIDSSPVVVGQRVFVGSADGSLYGVELKSGKELWRFEAGGTISASPAVGEGCLVVGTEEGMFYCFGEKPTVAARSFGAGR